jgi:GxxExxY protein
METKLSASKKLYINHLSKKILDAAMTVHTELGPGMLESSYEACLALELRESEIEVKSQVGLPLIYRGKELDIGYRLDMLIEDAIIVEIKAVERIRPIHQAQLLSYVKMSNLNLGFLINFNVKSLRDGIQRLVHRF